MGRHGIAGRIVLVSASVGKQGGAAEAGFDAVSDIYHKGTKDTKVNYCSVSCLNDS